jgi:hypothetical protein
VQYVSALNCAAERQVIGELQVTAHGQPARWL